MFYFPAHTLHTVSKASLLKKLIIIYARFRLVTDLFISPLSIRSGRMALDNRLKPFGN